MQHGKSEAVYDKGIAAPRTKFLWYHTTQYYSNVIEKKNKQRKVMYVVKEDHKPLGLFVERYPEKHEGFQFPLTTLVLAISTTEGKSFHRVIERQSQWSKCKSHCHFWFSAYYAVICIFENLWVLVSNFS